MCGAFERKENDFWELKEIIYTHDTAIKNDQVHHRSLKINSNCKYLALLH